MFSVKTQICMHRDSFPNKCCSQTNSVTIENNRTVKLPLPPITLESFENNNSDPIAYFTFKKTFSNALAGIPNLTNAQKLIYLKNFVEGEALNTTESIAVNDEGFKTAFNLLDFSFLNNEEIRDRTLDTILSLSDAKSLKEVETLIRTVNGKLHDLRSLNLDLLEVNSVGLVLVRKIVCNKLPRHFLIELFMETSTNYPNFTQLPQVYQIIVTRLKVNSKENSKELNNDVQVNKCSCKDGVKPKMLSKSSNPSSGKDTSEIKSGAVKGTSAKCRFVVLLITLPLIVMFIRLWKLGLN